MPKAEKGSVKDIAKRIKAKGLQKLKFFCQMCEKQCRDANGFKCHIQSESHLRQMKLFSENASGIVDQYSREFEKVFLDTLRMLHGSVHVNANNVYQQVIRDRTHIHMNSTMWATLSDFCQYLGKTGKCRVEETERGWYITYINRDVDQIVREQEAEKRLRAEQQAEAELQKRMEERRKEAALILDKADSLNQVATNLEPRDENQTILISIKQNPQSSKPRKKSDPVVSNVLGDDDGDDTEEIKEELEIPQTPLPAESSSKRMREQVEKAPEKTTKKHAKKIKAHPSVWLYRDILVRIIDQGFENGRYFRRKAAVDFVIDDDGSSGVSAQLTLLPNNAERSNNQQQQDAVSLRLPQSSLETVVPKAADSTRRVRILRGQFRGKKATVLSLNKNDYCATLQLSHGMVLPNMDFENFAEIAE